MDYQDDAMSAVGFLVEDLGLSDLNPVDCGWHRRERGRRFGPGIQDRFVLHYVLSGRGVYRCAGRSFMLEARQLFLIRPGQVVLYEADASEPWTYVWIGFRGDAAQRLLTLAGFDDDRLTAPLPEMEETFLSLRRRDPGRPLSAVWLCAKLYELLERLRERQTPPQAAPQPVMHVRRALAYIHGNYAGPITIEGMARAIGVDRRYLSRIFTEQTGSSPQAYLVSYRLEKAAALLAAGGCTVGEAAHSVGYADAFTFSRMYRKKYGLSPRESLLQGRDTR